MVLLLTVNGINDTSKLFEPPFTDVGSTGMYIFDKGTAGRIIELDEMVNRNAEVM